MSEGVFNALAAISVLSWGILGFHKAFVDGSLGTVRVCITCLHVLVAVLFAVRMPLKLRTLVYYVIPVFLSFVGAGFAFRSAPAENAWPPHAQVTFVLGTIGAIVALSQLGKSFAIAPAVRKIVVRGVYRYIRHPAYAAELLMIIACCMARPWWGAFAALLVSLFAIQLRIRAEEKELCRTPEYLDYMNQVRWRLLPKVY